MKKLLSILTQRKIIGLVVSLMLSGLSLGQFPGAVGQSNTDAVKKDSSIIVGWANECVISRGYLNISNPSLGFASFGIESDATGPANQTNVISLGDSGVAILTFPHPIFNGFGPDFVVFENSFNDLFLELGHVEVSSDGLNFFRFPSDFLYQTTTQIGPFDELGAAEKINNLAGKYRGGYGTPFDLEELNGITGLNISAITHVKIIDVVGSLDPSFGSFDQNNNPINDPFPTAFGSGGFDLDAIGVCHMQFVNSLNEYGQESITVFPNPVKNELNIDVKSSSLIHVEVYSTQSRLVLQSTSHKLNMTKLSSGIYQLKVTLSDGQTISKRIIKR